MTQDAGEQVSFTKRNHYNPCFWTAYWNSDYYRLAMGNGKTGRAREQVVNVLSIKSGSIFPNSVENVHYDQNLSGGGISREVAEDFARRVRPDRYEEFRQANNPEDYPVLYDVETILRAIEETPPYQTLRDVIRSRCIQSRIEKSNLGCFVLLQWLRSHAIMNSMIEWHEDLQHHRFEHFYMLNSMLQDQELLVKLALPVVACQWTLFKASTDAFPLCDSPVLTQEAPHSVMVAISPRLLLEIHPTNFRQKNIQSKKITPCKLAEFRKRTIGNTFREIIFGDRAVLEYWQSTPEFRNRVAMMKDFTSYNRLVEVEGSKEVLGLNAFRNKP